jgi:hypothetical protein
VFINRALNRELRPSEGELVSRRGKNWGQRDRSEMGSGREVQKRSAGFRADVQRERFLGLPGLISGDERGWLHITA